MYKIKAPRKALFLTRNLGKLTAINVAVFLLLLRTIKAFLFIITIIKGDYRRYHRAFLPLWS